MAGDKTGDKTGQKMGQKIGMKDVAARAGVSTMTVSRALFDPARVSQETRRRVAEAVASLGYLPDRVAGGLRSRRSGTVGCVIPSIAVPVFSDLVDGLTETLAARGFRLLIATSGYTQAGERVAVADLLAHRPEGLVLTGVEHAEETRALLQARSVPVVEVWDWTEHPIDLLVGYSNEAALRALVCELVRRGRRRIAFFGPAHASNSRAGARRRGYEQALAAAGLPPLLVEGEPTAEGGRAGARRLIDADTVPDAIVCVNDMIAIGAMYELGRAGLCVPTDVAVAGFADYEIARYCTPSLSTVRVPRRGIGVQAAALLIARAMGEPVAQRAIDMGFELIWRNST